MTTKNTILAMILMSVIGVTIFYLNNVYNHQVQQKVVKSDVNQEYFELRNELIMRVTCPDYLKSDGSVDSLKFKKANNEAIFIRKHNEEVYRKMDAPYILITSYNHHEIIDYGTAKQIDSLKCIRYHQMLENRKELDASDLKHDILIKESKKQIEDADKKAQEELDKLNKTCE